jgi:hypothetical protein
MARHEPAILFGEGVAPGDLHGGVVKVVLVLPVVAPLGKRAAQLLQLPPRGLVVVLVVIVQERILVFLLVFLLLFLLRT